MGTTQRFAIIVGAGLLALLARSAGAADQPPTSMVTLNIARQPLGDALSAFAQQSGLQVVFYANIGEGVVSPEVAGTYSPQTALDRLLINSSLKYEFINPRTVAIRPAADADSASSTRDGEQTNATQAMRLAHGDGAARTAGDEHSGRIDASARDSEAAERSIGEVIVTATKREVGVQDVPMSIAVLSSQDINRRGLIGMEDYLRSIPGVNQIDTGAAGNAIVIRGITTSPSFENANSGTTVGTYFDETPITGAAGRAAAGIDVRPVDIERIEVLRGPQGTAYGSASLGGTLRIIPAKPKLDGFAAKAAAAYSGTSGSGGDNSMIQGVVNIPVVEGKLALRAVGYRYDESGFYRNIAGEDPATLALAGNLGLGSAVSGFVQDDSGRMVSTGGRLSALWQPTDDLHFSLNILTQKIEQDGSPVAEVGDYELAHAPISQLGRVRGETGDVSDTDMDLYSLVLDYNLGWGKLTSAGSWIDGGSIFAVANRIAGLLTSTTAPSYFRSFTSETRLASQLDGPLQFLAGVFYEDVNDGNAENLRWLGEPAPSPVFVTNPLARVQTARELDQRAIFGEVSYDLTQKLTATVGGRFFKYSRDQSQSREGGLVGVPLGAGVPILRDSSESGNNFKANLSYKPTKDSLLYASWSQGFRLGFPAAGLLPVCDLDNDGLVDGTNVTIESTRSVDSDFLDNYEIGGKFAFFDRRMVIDTAIYHIKWDGLPIRAVATACNSGYTANVGAATSDGLEFQASLLVAEGLRLDFGGGYIRARLSEDAPGLAPPAFEDDRLPGSPKLNANLAAQYDFDVAGRKAFVRVDSFYTGKFYGDFLRSPGTLAGDYVKVDARVGASINKLSVELFVRNLTDENAFTWRGISPVPNVFAGYQLRPRTVGVQLGYSFE